MKEELVPPTTESTAERAWRYGLESTNPRDLFYEYVTFKDDSMMTKVGVYQKSQDAFRHADTLRKKKDARAA